MRKVIVFSAWMICGILLCQSQDTIVLKNGSQIIGTITGFDSSNVFVNQPNTSSNLAIPLDITNTITFGIERGSAKFLENNDTLFNRRMAITTSLFAPTLNHINLGMEFSIKPARSIHIVAGGIFSNFGLNRNSHLQGGYLRAGYRFYVNTKQYSGIHAKQHLYGEFYEFMLSGMRYSYQQQYYWDDVPKSNTITGMALQFIYGFQSPIFKNWFWGINVGAGYSITLKKNDTNDLLSENIEFVQLRPVDGLPISLTGMIVFGKKI